MSVVTNLILAYQICDDDHGLLSDINELNPGRGILVHAEDPKLPDGWCANGKALEVNIALGAFNHLFLDEWVEAIRHNIDFRKRSCYWAQFIVCGQDDEGFRVIDLFRAR